MTPPEESAPISVGGHLEERQQRVTDHEQTEPHAVAPAAGEGVQLAPVLEQLVRYQPKLRAAG